MSVPAPSSPADRFGAGDTTTTADLAAAPTDGGPSGPRDDVLSLTVQPGAEHWRSVPGRVEKFLGDHTSDLDLQTDVAILLSGALAEMLDHQGHRGAGVTVTVDARHTVTVEVFAGSSHREHDDVDPAYLAAAIAPPPREKSERASTLRLFDALAASWGTRRRHRKTTLWFTVEPTSGVPTGRGLAQAPAARPGHPPSHDPTHDEGEDPLADLLIDVVTLSTSLSAGAGSERRDVEAVHASTVARAARAAASRAALATERARVERDAAVDDAALTVAQTAVLARGLAQQQSDDAAESVARAAEARAAEDLARTSVTDVDVEQAARDALLVASAVAEAAALRAQEGISAAVLVADAVTTAAAAVAAAAAKAARSAEVAAEAVASELDVLTQDAARQRADEDALAQIVFERHQRLTSVTLARLMRSNELLREQVSRIDAQNPR